MSIYRDDDSEIFYGWEGTRDEDHRREDQEEDARNARTQPD